MVLSLLLHRCHYFVKFQLYFSLLLYPPHFKNVFNILSQCIPAMKFDFSSSKRRERASGNGRNREWEGNKCNKRKIVLMPGNMKNEDCKKLYYTICEQNSSSSFNCNWELVLCYGYKQCTTFCAPNCRPIQIENNFYVYFVSIVCFT